AAAVEAPASQPAEPTPAAETKLAALDAAPTPPVEAAPVPVEEIAAPAMIAPEDITRIATLGSPAAKGEKPVEAKPDDKTDRAEIRRQKRAERARERRRLAARRAKLAAQQAAAQLALNPFAQMVQQAQPATTTATATRHQ